MSELLVYINDIDVTLEASNYLVDPIETTLLATDEINIGYYKPINSIYLELSTANTNLSVNSLYYYNGTSFITTRISDETKGMARSGFISWGRNLTTETKTIVNGVEAYWYKLKLDIDSSAIVLDGLNLVFNSDSDLKEEYPSINDMLPEGKTSFINFSVASRKDILSYFKNQGKLVTTGDFASSTKLVDQFDLLNYEEIRDASKFLTLAKIFYWVSDSVDDKWHQKAKMFEAKYGDKISMITLSIDKNDNGLADNTEKNAIQFAQIVRR